MNKVIIATLMTLLSLIASTTVSAAAETDSLFLGNCEGRGVSFANSNVTGGALYFPASHMEAFAGNNLESVWIYFNAPASYINSLEIFVSGSLDEPYDVEIQGTPTRFGWNEIVFDQPYHLDGSAIYLGFKVDGAIISYAQRRSEGDEFSLVDGEWQPYTGIYSHAFYGVVRGDNLPQNDVAISVREPFCYALTGEPNTVEVTVTNNGLATVQSLTFTYDYGSGSLSETVEGLSIPYLSTSRVTLDGLVFPEAGQYDVTASATAVNGEEDIDPSNNISDVYTYTCLDDYVKRNVLLEIFSTELCSNCPQAHRGIDNIVDGNERVIEVGHHSAYYTDSYTIEASVEYEWFYGGHLSAPALMLDRTNRLGRYPELRTYEDNKGPVMGVGNSVEEALADALNTPAYASVNLDVTNDADGGDYRTLHIEASGQSLLPLPDNSTRLFVFLTEDSIFTATQAGATGSYYHRHSIRACVSETWGDAVDLEQGFSKSYDITIPDEWDMAKMEVIAFVAHDNETDYNDCKVYNSARFKLKPLTPQSAIDKTLSDGGDVLFDGSNLLLPEGCTGITLYSTSGAAILTSADGSHVVQLTGLEHGVYVYKAIIDGHARTGKLVL